MRKDRMKTKEYSAGSTALTVAFVLICLVWIMPIYEVVVNSLKSNNAINLDVFALPNSESFVGLPGCRAALPSSSTICACSP